MAGTDSSRDPAKHLCRPVVVLVEPQLGENIGAAARAMRNCGLRDLRLVAPRDAWPNPKAVAMASGATEVLDTARLFATTAEAITDLHRVYATTARHRDMVKTSVTPRQAAFETHQLAAAGGRCGFLFGRERIGLTNDEIALADALLSVPLDPSFSSLNLGQAVLLVAYEWYQHTVDVPPRRIDVEEPLATRAELFDFFTHFEQALEWSEFFKVDEMRPRMERNLRNLFHRAELTGQEVRTLRGVITALTGRRREELQGVRSNRPRK